MKTIDCDTFFARYVDPLRKDAAEWGAFAGFHGTEHGRGLELVRILARTALARAGLAVTARPDSTAERLASIESDQRAMRGGLRTAWRKLTGAQPFDSTRTHRVIGEAALELFAIPSLVVAQLASGPFMAWRRWRLEQTGRHDGRSIDLRQAAEDVLIVEFEWHFLKGEEARKHRVGVPVRVPISGEKGKEERHERSARVGR